MEYKISPSDLTFLYDQCKHCFVLKVKHGIIQPSIPIPGIFSVIAGLQKNYYSDMRTEKFCPDLPPGVVSYGEKRVRSKTIRLEGCESSFYINGRFDIVATLDDGSYAVLDFKTGNPSEEKTNLYNRQLHAYSIALENPAKGAMELKPISKLGLLYFSPDNCEMLSLRRQVLQGNLDWFEITRDDESFYSFLKEVIQLLDGPLPSPDPENCDWCSFLERSGRLRSNSSSIIDTNEQPDIQIPTCPMCRGPMTLKNGIYGEFWSCLKYPECKGTRNK